MPPDPSQLVVFGEPSGFSTTEVRDAQDHIVQFTEGGDLVWMADGTHLPGYAVDQGSSYWGPPTYFISGKICVESATTRRLSSGATATGTATSPAGPHPPRAERSSRE